MTTTNSESILDELFQSYSIPTQQTVSGTGDELLNLFEDHNNDNRTTNNAQSVGATTLDAALFGDLCLDETPSVRHMIAKQYNDEHELRLTQDTNFPQNKIYSFKNIHISDCTVSPANGAGIIHFRSLNDIVLENATIAFEGRRSSWGGSNFDDYKIPKELLANNNLLSTYGRALDQIYVGHRGHRGDSCAGGEGGNGIKLECKRLILRNSNINISGRKGSRAWWSGDGEGGGGLIICDEIEMDHGSTIQKGRVVLQINPKTKNNIKCLVHGYFRKYLNCNVIMDICNLCASYFPFHSFVELNKRIKSAIFVDNEWNAFNKEQLVKEAITAVKPGLNIAFVFKNELNDIDRDKRNIINLKHYCLNFTAYEMNELNTNVVKHAIENVLKKIGISGHNWMDWSLYVHVWNKVGSTGYSQSACFEMDIWNKLKLQHFDHSERIVLLYKSRKTLKTLQLQKSGLIEGKDDGSILDMFDFDTKTTVSGNIMNNKAVSDNEPDVWTMFNGL